MVRSAVPAGESRRSLLLDRTPLRLSFQLDPRVDHAVEQVAGEIHEDVRQRDDENRGLHLRVVAGGDRCEIRSRPRPGHEKICSVMIAPVSSDPNCSARTVITGISAFFSAWRKIALARVTPLAMAVVT